MDRFPQMFRDRADAGERLAGALSRFRGQHPLVLGIPRGGVPVAAVIARSLDGQLDLAVACRVGVPWQPELALGAVTGDGVRWMNPRVAQLCELSGEVVEELVAQAQQEARARERTLRGSRPRASIRGRTVIVVDDGLATGATMLATVRSVRARRPRHLIAAVPVGAQDWLRLLAREVDEVVCLYTPEDFSSVGEHYRAFPQTADEDVRVLLAAPADLGTSR